MFCEAFELFKGVIYANLTMHHLRIQGKSDKTALGHIAGGKRFIRQSPEPGMGTVMMLMAIPGQRNQDVDIQQIHVSFLG